MNVKHVYAWYSYGEKCVGRNFCTAKIQYGENSYGETSVREKSVRQKFRTAKKLTAKILMTKLPTAKFPSTSMETCIKQTDANFSASSTKYILISHWYAMWFVPKILHFFCCWSPHINPQGQLLSSVRSEGSKLMGNPCNFICNYTIHSWWTG